MSKKNSPWFGYSRKGPVEDFYDIKSEIGRSAFVGYKATPLNFCFVIMLETEFLKRM